MKIRKEKPEGFAPLRQLMDDKTETTFEGLFDRVKNASATPVSLKPKEEDARSRVLALAAAAAAALELEIELMEAAGLGRSSRL